MYLEGHMAPDVSAYKVCVLHIAVRVGADTNTRMQPG